MFGWSREDVIGRFNPLIPEEEHDAFLARLRSFLDGTGHMDTEVRRRRKDGSWLDVSLSIAPIRDADRNVIGSMGLIADVTGRKRGGEG